MAAMSAWDANRCPFDPKAEHGLVHTLEKAGADVSVRYADVSVRYLEPPPAPPALHTRGRIQQDGVDVARDAGTGRTGPAPRRRARPRPGRRRGAGPEPGLHPAAGRGPGQLAAHAAVRLRHGADGRRPRPRRPGNSQDAVTSGQAAAGEPWQYYDLGHGYCTYTFFEQCPHRMACARCDFYTPKASTKGELLEAKDNLQRTLANVPLTDDERAAVDDGQDALDRLLERLVDVPTPGGATPREIGVPATATLLPIVAVNHGKQG